jgi:hypothetical protein
VKAPRYRLANRGDHAALQRFTCAPPHVYPNADPEPWSSEVQGWIRRAALRDTMKHTRRSDQRLLLFTDESNSLVGVSAHAMVRDFVEDAPSTRLILSLAVDLRHRGEGIDDSPRPVTLAGYVVATTLQDIGASQPGPLVAVAKVRPANERSIALLRRRSFRPVAGAPGPSGLSGSVRELRVRPGCECLRCE